MTSREKIQNIIQRLHVYKNLESQANARYILYGVHEDRTNFPNFVAGLSEKTEYLSYLYLEVACSLFELENYTEATSFFEKGASLLEYNYAASKEENYSDYSLMVCSLAYYCACQYSKSFIVISKGEYNTTFTKLIRGFLTKRFGILGEAIKETLLGEKENKEWDDVFVILLARAMALIVCYFNFGDEGYLQRAKCIITDARDLAGMGDDPSIWWEFRLLQIIFSQIDKSSLWFNLHNNQLLTKDNEDSLSFLFDIGTERNSSDVVDKYIYALAFRKHPITELFISQREALEKVLMNESSVVSMPTSSGKTRIAEIVMLQSLLHNTESKILYIAPYISLAYEMEETFTTTFSLLDMSVTHLYGGSQFTSVDRAEMKNAKILIVTPEKAKAILRSNDDIVRSIKLVVMDEGHLLGTNEREIVNEMFTEELRRIVRQNNGKFLILSAVLPNAQDMSIWLANKEDRVVETKWRPSDQRIGLLCYYSGRVDLEWQGDYPCFNNSFVKHSGDKKQAVALTALKLSDFGSVLIYCPQNRYVITNADAMFSIIKDEADVDWGDDDEWVKFGLICQESEEGKHYLDLAKKGILCHFGTLNHDIRRYIHGKVIKER